MSDFSPFTFLHINDHHLGTPRSYRFRPAINRRWAAIKRQMSAIDADLLLIGGDLTRDGDTHEEEYRLAREDLDTLPFPTFVIPGNMDVGNKHTTLTGPYANRNDIDLNMTSARLQLFASHFGPICWSFLRKGVRFTGFYAAVAGSGLREEARFWRFMERLPELPRGRFHVAMMHYWLYMEDVNEPNWDITRREEYMNWYFSIDEPHRGRILATLKAAEVDALFCGHVHTGRPVDAVDGIRVYKTPAAGNGAQLTERWEEKETRQGFQRCEVTGDGIQVTFVPGADQCEEFDSYGPGGHPRIEDRDYSLAREKPALVPDAAPGG
ncbi:MAG: metallophosphoesterase [Armatimonadetes bacterium]|nr:metallophosphoesterase [Armatimonadota bacterium]